MFVSIIEVKVITTCAAALKASAARSPADGVQLSQAQCFFSQPLDQLRSRRRCRQLSDRTRGCHLAPLVGGVGVPWQGVDVGVAHLQVLRAAPAAPSAASRCGAPCHRARNHEQARSRSQQRQFAMHDNCTVWVLASSNISTSSTLPPAAVVAASDVGAAGTSWATAAAATAVIAVQLNARLPDGPIGRRQVLLRMERLRRPGFGATVVGRPMPRPRMPSRAAPAERSFLEKSRTRR